MLNLKGLFGLRKIFRRIDEGGFLFAELAIALPLLMMLIYSLANLTIKIFEITRNQVADYVLETEVQDVVERISLDARAATLVKSNNHGGNSNMADLIFYYNSVSTSYVAAGIVRETRRYVPTFTNDGKNHMVVKRNDDSYHTTPVTGGNFFGDTRITLFKVSELSENVLHITLEMESVVSGRKIKIGTAVFMPNCTDKEILNE